MNFCKRSSSRMADGKLSLPLFEDGQEKKTVGLKDPVVAVSVWLTRRILRIISYSSAEEQSMVPGSTSSTLYWTSVPGGKPLRVFLDWICLWQLVRVYDCQLPIVLEEYPSSSEQIDKEDLDSKFETTWL